MPNMLLNIRNILAKKRFSAEKLIPRIQNYSILREISQKEKYYFKYTDFSKCVRTFRIKSEIDYNKEHNLVKIGINEMMRKHPLLNAKIYQPKNGQKSYFIMGSESSKELLKNVEFLSLKEKISQDNHSEISKLLVERELTQKLDYSYNLFWKIIFYKICSINPSEHIYDVIFNVHHCISEERVNLAVFMQFLDILDMLFMKIYDSHKVKKYEIMPPIDKAVQNMPSLMESKMDLPLFQKPKIFDFKEKQILPQTQIGNFTPDDIANLKIWCDKINKPILKLQDLALISSTNKSKFIISEIDNKNFDLLHKMCKFYNVNMTCCLNLITSLALKMIYTKHEINRPISYNTMISPRLFIKDYSKFDYNNMGYFLTEHYDVAWFNTSIQPDSANFNDFFWILCKEKTNQLKLSINDLRFKTITNGDDFDPNNSKFYIDIMNSNIGKLPRSHSKYQCQKILKSNVICPVESSYFFAFNVFNKIDHYNGFNILYNSDFVSKDLVKSYLQNFNSILKQLVC